MMAIWARHGRAAFLPSMRTLFLCIVCVFAARDACIGAAAAEVAAVEAATEAAAAPMITASATSVLMGRSVVINVKGAGAGDVLFPFVNKTQWGAFCTASASGECSIILPLPVPGTAQIQVASLDRMWCQQPYPSDKQFCVGQPLPAAATAATLSNTVAVSVAARKIAPPDTRNRTVCVDWEPWFTPVNLGGKPWLARPGAEGVPLVGLYSSFDATVVRQHAIWFAARRSSAEHLIATKALRCTATAWMLIVAESFAKN